MDAQERPELQGVVGEHGYVVLAWRGTCVLCGRGGMVRAVRRPMKRTCPTHAVPGGVCPNCKADTDAMDGAVCVKGCAGFSPTRREGAFRRWVEHRGPGEPAEARAEPTTG